MRPWIAASLLALALVACGDDDDAVGGDTAVTSPPAGDAAPGAPERRLLEQTPGLLDPIPSAIESYAEVGDATIELRFYAGVKECYGLDRVEVVEESESVQVTVFVGSKPGPQACIEIAEAVATRLDLESPLGERTLLDGSTGEPVPVE